MGKVYQVDSEPIVVSVQAKQMTVETVRENREKTEALFQTIPGKKYLVIDLRETETSFAEILKIMMESGKGRDQTISADETMTFIVGGDKFVRLFRDKMQKNGINIAAFSNMADVMTAIRFNQESNTTRTA